MGLFRRMQIRIKSKIAKDRYAKRNKIGGGECSWNYQTKQMVEFTPCKIECPIYKKTCYRWDLCYGAKMKQRSESNESGQRD